MSSIPAMHTGIQGIQRGMHALRENAQAIASATVTQPHNQNPAAEPITDALVNLKLNELQVDASVEVIQTASDMIGTLLDIKV